MRLHPSICTFALLSLLTGCIQQSDTRSYYLHADGKIDVQMLLDDIHSSESGAPRGEEERKWLADFKRRATPELKRFKDASAQAIQVRLLRSQAPFSVLAQGRLESSRQLAVFLDLSLSDPKNQVTFVKDGKKRTLSIHVEKAKAASTGDKEKALSGEELEAEHRIFWQFIPLAGTLTATKACIISQDRRSCRLDVAELLRHDAEELSISWLLD